MDRSLEARIESARQASIIHQERTGKAFVITESIVRNEEMYEEDDGDLPRFAALGLHGNQGIFTGPGQQHHGAKASELLESSDKLWRQNEVNRLFSEMFPYADEHARRLSQQRSPSLPTPLPMPNSPTIQSPSVQSPSHPSPTFTPLSQDVSPLPFLGVMGVNSAFTLQQAQAEADPFAIFESPTPPEANQPISSTPTPPSAGSSSAGSSSVGPPFASPSFPELLLYIDPAQMHQGVQHPGMQYQETQFQETQYQEMPYQETQHQGAQYQFPWQ
jgi:hypothetical protein